MNISGAAGIFRGRSRSTVSRTYPYSFLALARVILRPESSFYWLVLVYALGIGALTLSIPLSVQVLIGTVVNSAQLQQVIVLAAVLLGLLALSGLFVALQVYLMELFERRFFSRIVSEVTLRLVYARQPYMESINRDELVNRYFDIMSVQKSLPPLLTGALATLLQAAVGIAVTSFYHPLFLLFNAAIVVAGYMIFRSFDPGAGRSALSLSSKKYDVARWLEGLARSNTFFKSRRTIAYALTRTADVRHAYVEQHRRHFRFSFAQVIGFLLLYAIASAALLGVGGWLVVRGQLTIGQLVAAELIFSAIFYGLTRIGYYLELYYELYAAMVKLVELYTLEPERIRTGISIEQWSPEVCFENVKVKLRGGDFLLDLQIAAGHAVMIETRSTTQITAITNLLLNFLRPQSGQVLLGGHDVDDFNAHELRDEVLVIDSATFPECSIAEYLAIADPAMTRTRMRTLLEAVGMTSELPELASSLDQVLTPDGHPLSVAGVIKLKIAFAIAADPRVIVLTPVFDMLSHEARTSILRYLHSRAEITVLCFTHRRDLHLFDDYVLCDFTEQRHFTSMAALAVAHDRVTGVSAEDRRDQPSAILDVANPEANP